LSHSGLDDSLCERIRADHPATILNGTVFHDFEGSACYTGICICWLDASGSFLSSFRQFPLLSGRDEDAQQAQILTLKLREGWMLHAFARMNCGNTKLVPIPGHSRHQHRNEPVRSSLWHEIKVTSAPQQRKQPATPDSEQREVRFHWVRGHYADYTKGAGLFGNPKLRAIFWIPEPHVGNEDLGTVVSSYRV
jgi:hypothetical protein